jgi:hypothetical protein
MRRILAPALLFLMFTACIAQQPGPATKTDPPALRLSGVGLRPTDLSLADYAALPRRKLTVQDHDAKATYEGVTVQDLLTHAGMTFGQSLRGPRLRDYLLAQASDGYAVIFALPELSEEFSDRVIIVADRMDGAPLPPREGPLKIIVSDEHKHARWVRNLVSLTVKSDPDAPAATPGHGDGHGAAGEGSPHAK